MTALGDIRRAFDAAGLAPVDASIDDAFQAMCPTCTSTVTVLVNDVGRIEYDCPTGCDASRIADEIHFRTAPAEGFARDNPPQATRRTFEKGGAFVLDAPDTIPAIWGEGDDVLWSAGEALLIAAPQGAGKTTLAGQIALARCSALKPELLGFPIQPDTRRVVYIAADRPQQIRRSMARMVGEDQRATLDERLLVWPGPLPFNVVDDPSALAAWLIEQDAGTAILDSLKDIAIGLAEDAVGAAVNQARQHVLAAGIEMVELHHQRKGQDGHKPRKLEDVFGSTWITAGAGSVVLLWGEPGDPYVELVHLKQPAAEVGPLTLHHDHERGRTTIPDKVDLLDLAAHGVTAMEAAAAIYDVSAPNRNQRERARRRLDKLADAGKLARKEPTEQGGAVTYRLPVVAHATVTPRDPQRDPLTHPVTQGHDLALQAVTHPVTQGHAQPGPPFKGAENGSVTPLDPDLDARLEDLATRHPEAA